MKRKNKGLSMNPSILPKPIIIPSYLQQHEIAGCSEKAYDSLSVNDARQVLLFSSDKELFEYIKEDHPEWEVHNNLVIFQRAKETALCKEIPSLQLINQTLSYARVLERIV